MIQNNTIGTNNGGALNLANAKVGIFVGSANVTIGGTSGSGNVIAFNSDAGIVVAAGQTAIPIRFNAIYGNNGPGIDLNNDGVTPNLPGGANNTPIITSADNGTIVGSLNAARNAEYFLDFYIDD